MLLGRSAETAEIDRLLDVARNGRSAVLTIVGEAGIGKTALLGYAAVAADGFEVLRCTGVESEAELPYAALHFMLRPYLDRAEALPAPQVAALRGAFGLAAAPAVDRFLVGLATLGLLAEIAEDGPVLCLIDDAQWLDRESSEALLFAGRRLDAEPVVIVGATRLATPPCQGVQQGDGQLRLAGLDPASAAALVEEHGGDLEPDVRARLVEEARGNPLALLEFTAAVRGEQPRPVGPLSVLAAPGDSRVQDAFWTQVARLPAATRTVLLVAAADGSGDRAVILSAVERLGAHLVDLKPAEDAGLVRSTDNALTFRHPLVRSAVYAHSAVSERVAAHRALAGVLERPEDADRRAWHLAAAVTGPDPEVAGELESAAGRARQRGGYAASSAASERAARLSVDPERRCARLANAAFDARVSGQLARAVSLAEEAAALPACETAAARLAWVRASVDFERGAPRRAAELLVRAAADITEAEPERAGQLLLEAVRMAYFADRATSTDEAAEMIDSLALPDGHPLRPALEAASVAGRLLAGCEPERLPPLHHAVRALRPDLLHGAAAVHAASAWQLAGRTEESYDVTSTLVSAARDRGLVAGPPHLLLVHAESALFLGRLREALSAATEGLSLAEVTDQEHSAAYLRSVAAQVAAMTGDEERCVALAQRSIEYGAANQAGAAVVNAGLALTVLDLGLARYESAYDRLRDLGPDLSRHLAVTVLAAPERIEAAVRSGRPEEAVEILHRYETWSSRHQEGPTGRAIGRRCRALLGGDGADEHFRAALRLHRQADRPLAQARTELLYGEWLRRERRKTEAKAQLRSALRRFESAGARSWAERARSELRATGETVTSGEARTDLLARLTPQELQVARLAATGLTNRDIGARLLLSPRTVGYHLYKVFPKLGISGRADLARMGLDTA